MAASCRYFIVILALLNLATCRRSSQIYSNTWVVQVDGGQEGAERIAAEKDLTLLGQVKEIFDIKTCDLISTL